MKFRVRSMIPRALAIQRFAPHFPGNRIPANRISAVSAKMLPFLPTPELPGIVNNSIAPLGSPRADERTLGFKIDHQITTNHRISGMYNDTYRPSVKSPGSSRLIPVGRRERDCSVEL